MKFSKKIFTTEILSERLFVFITVIATLIYTHFQLKSNLIISERALKLDAITILKNEAIRLNKLSIYSYCVSNTLGEASPPLSNFAAQEDTVNAINKLIHDISTNEENPNDIVQGTGLYLHENINFELLQTKIKLSLTKEQILQIEKYCNS